MSPAPTTSETVTGERCDECIAQVPAAVEALDASPVTMPSMMRRY